jgi:predicted nucleic acid-binding protein
VTLVIDASVAAKWVLPEMLSERAEALRFTGEPLIAPDLVFAEIGNALCKRAIKGEITTAIAIEALETATGLFSALVPMAGLATRAAEIAITMKHPIYDCLYLALAERERAPLVTADKKLLALGKRVKNIEVRAL